MMYHFLIISLFTLEPGASRLVNTWVSNLPRNMEISSELSGCTHLLPEKRYFFNPRLLYPAISRCNVPTVGEVSIEVGYLKLTVSVSIPIYFIKDKSICHPYSRGYAIISPGRALAKTEVA